MICVRSEIAVGREQRHALVDAVAGNDGVVGLADCDTALAEFPVAKRRTYRPYIAEHDVTREHGQRIAEYDEFQVAAYSPEDFVNDVVACSHAICVEEAPRPIDLPCGYGP